MKEGKRHNRGPIALAALALALAVGMSVQSSLAYFTTYVTAKGGYTLSLGDETTVREEMDGWKKIIRVENVGEKECYVRVKAFAASQFDLEYADASGKWSLSDDGYWYYADIVPVGGMTEALEASIVVPEGFEESFNVVVVQECTPVLYNEDGSPYADWEMKAQSGEEAE